MNDCPLCGEPVAYGDGQRTKVGGWWWHDGCLEEEREEEPYIQVAAYQ